MKFKIFKEFKDFAVKGNMIEIAIGVIIGASFNKVVDVIVKEIFVPPLSLLTDGISFSDKKWVLRDAVIENGEPIVEEVAIGYGKLIETGIDFLIITFTVFLVVKLMGSIRDKAEDPDDVSVKTPKDIELLNSINTQLEKQNSLIEQRINTGSK